MDSITIVIVLTFMFSFPSSVHPVPAIYNRGVDNGLYSPGSLWHVFRQVHASDLAIGRTIIPSNSSKVVEKTIIIPKEESKAFAASFTIISRIQPPAGWASSKPMRPVNGVMNVVSIGARIKPDKTSTELFDKKSSQPFDGELMKRTSPWSNSDVPPDESESLIKEEEEEAANAPSIPAVNLGGFYSVRNGQIQFHDGYHQRDVEGGSAGGSGRNRPAAEPINILWEKFVPEELRRPQKQSADKMTTNRSDGPVENDGQNGNRLDDHLTGLITQQYLESPLVVQDNDRLVIRVNATTIYVASTSFPNGTIIFELSTSNSSIPKGANWKNLAEAEEMYPGFTKMASIRPVRVMIDGSGRNTISEKEHLIKDDLPTPVQIDDKQTVLVPSTSPWSSTNNNTISIIFRNQNGSNIALKPIEMNKVLKKPDTSTSPTVITEIPSGPIDEQMAPPVLPPLTQLQVSSSSTSSSSSWLVHHSQPGENQPISDWGMAGQVMQRPRLQPSDNTATSTTTTSSSTTTTTRKSTTSKSTTTTRKPTTTVPSSTTTAPSSTTKTSKTTTTWKPMDPDPIAASMQIVNYLLGSSTEQSVVTAVADQPPIRSPLASTQPSSIQTRPTYANNNKTLILSYSNKLEPLPASPKEESSSSGTGGGLASLILAHTAALIAGKPSPFGRQPGVLKQPVSVPAAAPSNKTSSTSVPGVHIILATALPDHVEPEDDYRYRSLDSSIESNETKTMTMSKDSSSSINWAFPSFNQLINSADSFLNSALSPFFPLKSVEPPVISSYNQSTPMDPVLPLLPRFSCGQETSMDESVLTNPSFPEPDSSSGHCTFRLRVTSNNVCQVRVGFEESRMLLPRQGFCKDQHLSVSGSIVAHPSGVENKFCGWNSDQHFYLELTEPEEEGQRVVEFNIDTQTAGHLYRYSLILQQIQCSPVAHPAKAPRGCFQYFYSGRSGIIKSFNYDGRQYWNQQSYRICVRSVDQSCTLTLTSRNGEFGLNRAGGLDRAGVGSEACPRDYLWIPGSVRSDRNAESNLQDRYCGPKLSDRNGDPQPGPVVVRMYSSVHIMEFRTETPVKYDENSRGPGFKIGFTQTDECPTGIARIPEEGLVAVTTTTEGKDGFDEIYNSLQRLRQLQLD